MSQDIPTPAWPVNSTKTRRTVLMSKRDGRVGVGHMVGHAQGLSVENFRPN